MSPFVTILKTVDCPLGTKQSNGCSGGIFRALFPPREQEDRGGGEESHDLGRTGSCTLSK